MDAIKVYLNGILLPVPPQKITRSIKNQNKNLTTISGQQITMIRPAGLTEFTLSGCLLPNVAYDFAELNDSGSQWAAAYYLGELEKMKQSTTPITFVTNSSEDGLCDENSANSILVTLEDYKITQSDENGLDVEVEIKLKQYVKYGLESVSVDSSTKQTSNRSEKDTEEQTYVVQAGDTLWAIAKKFYGDGSKYPYLAKLNNISNPNIIHVGQVLKIGSKADALASASATSSGTTSTKKTTSTTKSVKNLGISSAAIRLEAEKTAKSIAASAVDIQSTVKLSTTRPYSSIAAAKSDYNKNKALQASGDISDMKKYTEQTLKKLSISNAAKTEQAEAKLKLGTKETNPVKKSTVILHGGHSSGGGGTKF